MQAAFRVQPPDGPLRAIVVGAGHAGRHWMSVVQASPEVVLAGVVDLDVAAARGAVASIGVGDMSVATSLSDIVGQCGADLVIDTAVPAAHLSVTLEALSLGLPVLGEKPLAASLPEALVLIAASELAGELFMVSQSRRYDQKLADFKKHVMRLGQIGIATTDLFRAHDDDGFRAVMDHPLLLDMAIHAFDAARFLLDAEPVSVLCDEYSPPWSWYAGAAAATATFDMSGGQRYIFTGSCCSPGFETSWNGAWRISARGGTARWDGDGDPELAASHEIEPEEGTPKSVSASGTAGALASFVDALRSGVLPTGEAHENVMSMAMVAAAIQSSSSGGRIWIPELLERSLEIALATSTPPVREALASWTSAADALSLPTSVTSASPILSGW